MKEHYFYINTIHTHASSDGEVTIGMTDAGGEDIILTIPGEALYADISYIINNAITAKQDSELEINDRTRRAVKTLAGFLPPGKRGRKPKK
jgi:hypothetical protein